MSKLAEILDHIGKRPGMYFGSAGPGLRSIHLVSAFITGYQHGVMSPDETLPFTHFTRWVAAHYRVKDGAMNGFSLILDHVGGDQRQAFDEFFRLLPKYAKDVSEVGLAGIEAHYNEVMAQMDRMKDASQ